MVEQRRHTPRGRLAEVGLLFFRLGVIGFGGPAAHIAMMRDEVVRRRRWLSDIEFLELVGATNLIPGPNSTELAIHLGHRRAGVRGLLLAGVAFIGPAVVIVSLLAWLYARFGTDPMILDLRYGVLPVVIGIIAVALYGLGRAAARSPMPALVAVGALLGYVVGVHELAILVAGGAASGLWHLRDRLGSLAAVVMLAPRPVIADSSPEATPWRILAVFLEIGSVLYGSGYVLLAFLQRNLVEERGWITSSQLLDAIAVGQVTPGPVFTTATFVGWQIDGPVGALAATLGIFAPSFVFVALLGVIVPWMRARPWARAALEGVSMASLGLMAGVFLDLIGIAVVDWFTAALAFSSLVVLSRTAVNSAWLVLIGLAIGGLHAVVR